jgi:hypothetical protein
VKWTRFFIAILTIFAATSVGAAAFYNLGGFWRGAKALSVVPVYPTNGTKWTYYVKNYNGGTDEFDQPDTACAGTEAGYYTSCIHGGEKRKVVVTGYSSCTNLSISDALGAWEWKCKVASGVATFFTVGFKSGKGLGDLLNATSWKTNNVTVKDGAKIIGQCTSCNWGWTNTVAAPTNNSLTSNTMATLSTADTVYAVSADTNTSGYNINADHIAFVVLPGYQLTYNGRTNANSYDSDCDAASGSWNSRSVICIGGQKFIWIEGKIWGDSSNTNEHVITVTSNSKYSRFHNIYANNSIFEIFYFELSTQLLLTGLKSDNGLGKSPVLDFYNNANYNRLVDADFTHMTDPAPNGSWYQGGIYNGWSQRNQFYNIKISGMTAAANGTDGSGTWITVDSAPESTFVRLQLYSAPNRGIYLINNTASRNTFHGMTVANSFNQSITFSNTPSNNTFNQALLLSAWQNIWIITGASNKFSQLAVYGGNNGILTDTTATSTLFENNILIGTHSTRCTPTNGNSDGFTSACGNANGNAANWVNPGSLASSVVGKVTTNDTTNASDSNGTQAYTSITDWSNFDSPFRQWGLDGSAFSSFDNRGACVSGSCRIWDWRLTAAQTLIRNTSETGSSATPNGAFTVGATCPTAVSGNKTITDQMTMDYYPGINAVEIAGDGIGDNDGICETGEKCRNVFLINAYEIVGDGIGDDDGLCESNEACVYMPNFGAYQGEGTLSTGTCNFTNGTVTGVQMYGYPTNGQ